MTDDKSTTTEATDVRQTDPPAHAKPVIVGIDGSESAQHALEWAAAEAAERHAPLVIAHAGDLPHRGALTEDTAQRALREIQAFGRELLDDAVATVVEQWDGLDVSTELRDTSPESLLIELSAGAELVVVGRSGRGALGRALLGSVSHRVAAHATCPIVIVDGALPSTGRIVVGVSPTTSGRRAVEFAAAEAARRGVALEAIRSWNEAALLGAGAAYGNVMPYVALADSEQAILDEAIEVVKREYPSVTVTWELTPASPYEILPDEAEGAALMVVGRRRDGSTLLPHLGALASWLAQHASCPLVIVPGTD